jgi:hypothetical protein
VTRVLVAEDQESFSDAPSYQLRRQGFDVASCSTGPAVVDSPGPANPPENRRLRPQRQPPLDDTRGDGDAYPYQDDAADELAPVPGPGAYPAA